MEEERKVVRDQGEGRMAKEAKEDVIEEGIGGTRKFRLNGRGMEVKRERRKKAELCGNKKEVEKDGGTQDGIREAMQLSKTV